MPPSTYSVDPTAGQRMMALAEDLFPICRSITGPGVRQTLARLQELTDLEQRSVASGTQVLDWRVPDEWSIRDAYIKNAAGERVIDFQASNLHVVSYSLPVHDRMPLEALRPHLHSLPEQPERIPYRTAYYRPSWGFCLSQRQLETLAEGTYEVRIDSTLAPGALDYGELLIPGQSEQEVLFSTHICHPSLANDNVSGICLLTFLARALAARGKLRYSYRFLFIPGTIGAITWLAQNEEHLDKIRHGLVVAGVGDRGALHYKLSRRGAPIDRAVLRTLKATGAAFATLPWHPYGYDERQFCSPGFDLPVGRLSRSPYGSYAEYHTSGDDLSFITASALQEALEVCLALVDTLEASRYYQNAAPRGEPQLGRRGLYRDLSGAPEPKDLQEALLWLLSLSDTQHSLADIAEASGLPRVILERARDLLVAHNLLIPLGPEGEGEPS